MAPRRLRRVRPPTSKPSSPTTDECCRHGCQAATRSAGAYDEELAASGGRPRKIPLTGLDSLTPSERRVAQLAAEDLSNKEIAQSLFVTVKTVEVHVTHVYRKLDIGSRRQLATALRQRQAEPVAAGR